MVERIFYRIVKADPPEVVDFMSNQAKGLPRREGEPPELYDGISVYETEAQARRKATRYRSLGSYIAALRLPEDGPIQYRRTTASRGHHTLWGEPQEIRAHVVAVLPVFASDQEGNERDDL
jgi:hypothetical protein